MGNPLGPRRGFATWFAIVGLLIGAALVFAACGNGDDDTDAVDTTSSTPASNATTSSTSSTTSDTSTATSEPTTGSSDDSTTDDSTSDPPTGNTVEVFYSVDSSDCGEVKGFVRSIDDDFDLYRTVFQQLVAGPTAEEAGGVGSFFSSETADVVKSAVLTDDLLTVDFVDLRPLMSNASTSCGSQALLAQLNATAFQFAAVERTRYLLEGSCTEFGYWLQRECFETDRSGQQLDVSINDQASGAGCTPASTETLPAGRWFGFVVAADADQLSFDLACWFTGEAAVVAAAEDGAESPPPNDYHIRNESDRVRSHQVDSATEVVWLPNPGDPASTETVSYEDWLAGRATRTSDLGVWLTTTDDSHVTRIEEQYVP